MVSKNSTESNTWDKLAGSSWAEAIERWHPQRQELQQQKMSSLEFPLILRATVSVLCLPGPTPQKTRYLGCFVGCKISVRLNLAFSSLRSQACLSQHGALCDLAARRAASKGWWCQLGSSEALVRGVQLLLAICSTQGSGTALRI